MSPAARSPEELETLFEDALLTRDGAALAALFADGAVLALDGEPPARGAEIPVAALDAWGSESPYLAEPQAVIQARNVALMVADGAITVARREADGTWQYAIVLRLGSTGTETERSHA